MEITFVGQPIGFIIADTPDHAKAAAQLVVPTYTNVQPGIFTIDDAITANSYWPLTPATLMNVGDAAGVLKTAPHTVTGSAVCGGQYHFYMETQTCMALPLEDDKIQLHHATQLQQIIQQEIAGMLKIPLSKVDVQTRRCGGGYGGKLNNSMMVSFASAYAAWKLNVPVKVVMDITDCTQLLGGRTPYRADYTVGFDDNGIISAISMNMYANGGAGTGGQSLENICANVDNVYNIPNWFVNGKICKTNQPMSTSVRGPGWVPATFIMEHIMNHVGKYLNRTGPQISALRQANFYAKGDKSPTGDIVAYFNMPTIWSQIQSSSNYQTLYQSVQTFNSANKFRTQGISLVPVKFQVGYGQSFTTRVSVLQDGSVQVSTGGIEIGQGLDTKVVQVVAKYLGCSIGAIDIGLSDTKQHTVTQVTGGSMSSELCCLAAINACGPIATNLAAAAKALPASPAPTFAQIAAQATTMGMVLWNEASSNSPAPSQGTANYNSYSAALAVVELDVLTGETQVQRVDILFDCGVSLSPLIDIGQIEGGFIMGMGYYMTEERLYPDGTLLNDGTWEYKPPSALDIPISFNVSLLANAPNPNGVLGSKATGEPPLCSSCSVMFATEDALDASLTRRGKGPFVLLDAPATVDVIQVAADISMADYVFA
jgi:xanthine dehydrogenase/oxidase